MKNDLELSDLAGLAERLRRCTRNAMGSARTGSNPVASGFFFLIFFLLVIYE